MKHKYNKISLKNVYCEEVIREFYVQEMQSFQGTDSKFF